MVNDGNIGILMYLDFKNLIKLSLLRICDI